MTYKGCPPVGGKCNYQPKVLVVDDQEEDLMFARLGLERQGFRVKTHLLDKPEDLVALENRIFIKGYDFVLSDTNVGRFYGPTDVVKAIKSSGVPVPFGGWTNLPSPEHEAKWRKTEAKGYFVKPAGFRAYEPIAAAIRDSIDCRCRNP